MSLNPCQYCVMLTKVSSAYRTGYACGTFARLPCLVKDLGHFSRNLLQNLGLMPNLKKEFGILFDFSGGQCYSNFLSGG